MASLLFEKKNLYLRVIQPIRWRISKSKIALWIKWVIGNILSKNEISKSQTTNSGNQSKRFLSAFLRFKNEAKFLPEWICHHHLIGVEHFYLYNNNSDDNYSEVLAPFINKGLVTLIEWPHQPASPGADHDCVARCVGLDEWLLCIDADEFVIPLKSNSLADEIRRVNPRVALAINWRIFGSNGHTVSPRMVMNSFTTRNEDTNRHVKVIVRPEECVKNLNSHSWIYKKFQAAVDENKNPVYGSFNDKLPSERITIHHYYSKSAEDYLKKCNPSWWVDESSVKYRTHQEDFLKKVMLENNDIEDLSALRFVPAVKSMLKEYGFPD
jgi:hypothetical protein